METWARVSMPTPHRSVPTSPAFVDSNETVVVLLGSTASVVKAALAIEVYTANAVNYLRNIAENDVTSFDNKASLVELVFSLFPR